MTEQQQTMAIIEQAGLGCIEAKIAKALTQQYGEWMDTYQLIDAVYDDPRTMPADVEHTIRGRIHDVRAKLRPLGLVIEGVPYRGRRIVLKGAPMAEQYTVIVPTRAETQLTGFIGAHEKTIRRHLWRVEWYCGQPAKFLRDGVHQSKGVFKRNRAVADLMMTSFKFFTSVPKE